MQPVPGRTGAARTRAAEKNKTHGEVKKQSLFSFCVATEHTAARRAEGEHLQLHLVSEVAE